MAMQNGGEGGVFELSQKVLSILLSNPYELLAIVRMIMVMAIAMQVSKLKLDYAC